MPTALQNLQEALDHAAKVVGFSGAGISTESGIPDFRSPDGIWSKNRTVYYQEFLDSEGDRQEYWRQKTAMWPEMKKALPNEGHFFFTKLHEAGKLTGMITQNIEKLHQKSGLPDEKIIELHGNMVDVVCLDCGALILMDKATEEFDVTKKSPRCKQCGGLLKPATISFGQMLRSRDLEKASQLSENCDLFLAVGSSLVVQPAASFPQMAKMNGAKLFIINRDATPLDGIADGVIHREIGSTLKKLKI